MGRVVLQKLLLPGMSELTLERGHDRVGGFVIEAAAGVGLRTPSAIREAYYLDEETTPWVDVVRFEKPACSALSAPSSQARPWPSYTNGFLRPVNDTIAPVWKLSTTRYSPGAELWRIHDDARQEHISTYRGAAFGWTGAREWRPSSRYYGTRAVCGGVEYAADITDEMVELTAYTQAQPAGQGWVQPRPATWSRAVPLADTDIYELAFNARFEDVPVRVLEVSGETVRAELLTDDPAIAEPINANLIDLGVFELTANGAQLTHTELVANQVAQPHQNE